MTHTNYTDQNVRDLVPTSQDNTRINKNFTSLGQFVCVRFPKTFEELESDLKDAASYKITQEYPELFGRRLQEQIDSQVQNDPFTHFDLFRQQTLREGIWEGIGGKDYVDGLLFFYVVRTALDNACKLKALYDCFTGKSRYDKNSLRVTIYTTRNGSEENPVIATESEFRDARIFYNKYKDLGGFFENQVAYFTDNREKFVAISRCLEVYYASSGQTDNFRYYSRFDLKHFYELATPIHKADFEKSLTYWHNVEFTTKSFGEPCFIPAIQARHLLNMIAYHNKADFIKTNSPFCKWLQNYEISDSSKYDNINNHTWKKYQTPYLFDFQAREDQDIRAYFTNHFISELAESHKNNPDVNLVYRERRLYRNSVWTNSYADYMIQIGNTSSKYWLPVEVKIDVKKEPELLTQIKKYINCDGFINPNGSKTISIIPHSIVLILDKHGVYITEDGEFIENCGFDKPLWNRHLFAKSDHDYVSEVRYKLVSMIRKSSASKSHTESNSVLTVNSTTPVNTRSASQNNSQTSSANAIQSKNPHTSNKENPPTKNSQFWWFMIPISLMILAYLSEYDWPIILLIPTIAIVIKNLRSVLKLIGLSIIIFVILVIVLWITYGYLTS